jgi:hypothetical protein
MEASIRGAPEPNFSFGFEVGAADAERLVRWFIDLQHLHGKVSQIDVQ